MASKGKSQAARPKPAAPNAAKKLANEILRNQQLAEKAYDRLSESKNALRKLLQDNNQTSIYHRGHVFSASGYRRLEVEPCQTADSFKEAEEKDGEETVTDDSE